MAVPPPVQLKLHLSDNFIQEVTGKQGGQTGSDYAGSWVYLYNTLPPSGETPFTTVIDGGQLQNGSYDTTTHTYTVTIDLTNATSPYASGGALYLLVQSEALTTPGTSDHANNLATRITKEDDIEPNVSNWQFGYAQFEYTLSGKGGDAGDLTAIPGFALNTQLAIGYDDGTTQYRGYAEPQGAVVDALKNHTSTNVLTYDGGQLANETMMVISPSNQPMKGGTLYPESDWTDYLTKGFAEQRDLLISGQSNGEYDANGVWHNSQYYSYSIQSVELVTGSWGNAGRYFVFSPKEGSQTQAWMVISEADLQANLYSPGQKNLYIYEDPYLTRQFVVPGSGSPPGSGPDTPYVAPGGTNDEFGNVLTQVFTGFTAGYWASVAKQLNPYNGGMYGPENWAAQPLNLNNNANWDTAYAFGNSRDTTISPKPSYGSGQVQYDSYSEYFFYHSNVYGSAFSDNLSVGRTPGPLIPLGQPDATSAQTPANNVSSIDFFVYGSQDPVPSTYTAPTGGPFLPVAATQDYLIPDVAAGTLQFKIVGQDGQTFLRSDLSAQLGIYKGQVDGHGMFEYVTLPTGGNIWQTYGFSGSPGAWTVSANAQVPGTILITGVPIASGAAEGDVGWYQFVISDTEGRQKVYEFYTTAGSTAGEIKPTVFDVAVAGGASFDKGSNPTLLQIDLKEFRSAPVEMLTFSNAHGASAAAPVAGTLVGGVFTALDDQDGTGMPNQDKVPASSDPSLAITSETPLAFGWTGTNNGTHSGTPTKSVLNEAGKIATYGLISNYTNQIVPGHIAQVKITQTSGSGNFSGVLEATPDLDGRWQTTTTATLGNGTYHVVMQELEGDGVTLYGPQSVALTLTVTGVAATGAVAGMAAEISADLDTYGANLPTSITISDNEALTVKVSQITGDAGALLVTQNADTSAYKLIVQDRAANVAAALSALGSNTHLQKIKFTDVGPSVLEISYGD